LERPEAWLLSIGNELLIGRIVNTNAAWLGEKLTLLGFRVRRIVTVPDELADIEEEVGRAFERARVVITTGGLGPTYDDITLEGVARAVGRRLVLHPEALEMVRSFYEARGLPLTEERKKMAMLPEGAEPIPNPVGAAPGSLLRIGGKLIVSLPGVPSEMKAMFEAYVEPVLRSLAPDIVVVECGARIEGVPESSLAPIIRRAARMFEDVYVKSHPKGHETMRPILEVKALASGTSRSEAEEKARKALSIIVEGARSLGGEASGVHCG